MPVSTNPVITTSINALSQNPDKYDLRDLFDQIKIMLAACCIVMLSACKTIPEDEALLSAPSRQVWAAENTLGLSTAPQAWLSDLNSPELEQLVIQADQNNYSLRSAYARWQAAKAQTTITNAGRLPDVSADGDASRNRANARTSDRLSANLRVNWELDVWQRLADQTRGALLDEQAFAVDYQAARLALAANVSQSWYSLIEADQQYQLASDTAETFRQSLDVIEERYRRGLNSALDVRLARSDLATAQNEMARRDREKDSLARQIDVLLGRYPAAELKTTQNLPDELISVPIGLPADLLARRPDILAAEARLDAAGARLSAARKNRLPQIRLSGSGGFTSDSLAQLLDWDSLVFTLLAGIVQPIYQGGRLDAERTLASAQQSEAWANYIQTVLIAFREVETTLAAESRFTRQLSELRVASEEAEAAADLALQRYQNGLTDIITLLQSQRQAFNSRSQYLSIQRQRLNNRIDLYLALGGDFLNQPQSEQLHSEKKDKE